MKELTKFFAHLHAAAGTAQLVVLAVTAIVVTVGVVWGRRWYVGRPENGGNARGIVTDAMAVTAPYLAGLVIVGLARRLLGGGQAEWLETAWILLAWLALIRLLAFLLRLSLGRGTRIKAWELRITLIIWALIAAELLGWTDAIVAALDSVGLSKGAARITIWSVLKAFATVTAFVVFSVWIARWIDRRISTVQELAPSTRIGIGKFSYAFLIALGVLLGLQAAGVDLTALTVFSGAIGLGLGFGLQAIAANFVSGFVLLIDRSIKPI